MSNRYLPVRPQFASLENEARTLLLGLHEGDATAISVWQKHQPAGSAATPRDAKLSQAQRILAREYGVASWRRLALACRLIDAIWEDDTDAVCTLVKNHPKLLHEMARGTKQCNWGPPMSYAANLGRDRLVWELNNLGATDHRYAFGRAVLQGKIATARQLHNLAGNPPLPDDCLGGPAYTLCATGTELLLELGARVVDRTGNRLAPVDVVLESDSRNPIAKHRILELYVQNGLVLPDTPTMALHRGRLDLLDIHFRRDPTLLSRTFAHEEIYPPELGCHDEVLATHGTPLNGATLLHMCVDYDELEIARWLLDRGMDPDSPAAIDSDGFGGHTALFATVVSQPNFWMNYNGLAQEAPFTRLLLDAGADPNIRATLRKRLHPGYGPEYDVVTTYEFHQVTPLGFGKQFHAKVFVSEPAMELIAARGGQP